MEVPWEAVKAPGWLIWRIYSFSCPKSSSHKTWETVTRWHHSTQNSKPKHGFHCSHHSSWNAAKAHPRGTLSCNPTRPSDSWRRVENTRWVALSPSKTYTRIPLNKPTWWKVSPAPETTAKTPATEKTWTSRWSCKRAGRRWFYDVAGWWRKYAACGRSARGRRCTTRRRRGPRGACPVGNRVATGTASSWSGGRTTGFRGFPRRMRAGCRRRWWRRWRTWRGCERRGWGPARRSGYGGGGGARGTGQGIGLWRRRGRTTSTPTIGRGSIGSLWLMGVLTGSRLRCWSSSLNGEVIMIGWCTLLSVRSGHFGKYGYFLRKQNKRWGARRDDGRLK